MTITHIQNVIKILISYSGISTDKTVNTDNLSLYIPYTMQGEPFDSKDKVIPITGAAVYEGRLSGIVGRTIF